MQIPEHLILFDGICNLCNKSVQTVLKSDSQNIFRFASLQSAIGKELLKKHSIDELNCDSIVYFQKGKPLLKSDAALWITVELKFPLNLLAGLIVIPAFIRNAVYDFIAKNRYKWFGKSESCMMPEERWKDRFIG